ncbi:ferredoxin, 4Fe-4S [Bacillus freudenreichii]|nr:ferredoxin, 4Fe-4S [Bacillus freudenreichii]
MNTYDVIDPCECIRAKEAVKRQEKWNYPCDVFLWFFPGEVRALDFMIKGIVPGAHLPLDSLYGGFKIFQEIVNLMILVAVVRRYIEKLVRLKRGWKSGLVLISAPMASVLIGNGKWAALMLPEHAELLILHVYKNPLDEQD